MSNDVPLREFVEDKFEVVEGQLDEIKEALNYLSSNMVPKERFDSKMHDVKELKAMVGAQDKRIIRVEHFQSVLKYIGGVIATILIGVAIAKLTGLI
jgi:hypothetical protein